MLWIELYLEADLVISGIQLQDAQGRKGMDFVRSKIKNLSMVVLNWKRMDASVGRGIRSLSISDL